MSSDTDLIECIEGCRTCGVFYLTTSNYLRDIFSPPVEASEMAVIRAELSAWNVDIKQNDGFPQYICTACIHEFQRIFKFRRSCTELQQQWRHYYNLRQENKIKTEVPDPEELQESACDFIYVDDLSDDEYSSVTPCNTLPMPIKNEVIEAATIPSEYLQPAELKVEDLDKSPEQAHDSIQVEPAAARTIKEEPSPEELPATTVDQAAARPSTPLQTAELEAAQMRCDLCLHLSANRREHLEHKRRIHETKDMACHICGKKFKNSTANRLKFHLKWHKLNRHIKCAKCGFYCDSRATLKEHVRAAHTKIQCSICGKHIVARRMKMHQRECRISTEDVNWGCTYCSDVFASEAERDQHIWRAHDNNSDNNSAPEDDVPLDESKPFIIICAHCDKTFENSKDLELHASEHFSVDTTAPINVSDSSVEVDSADTETSHKQNCDPVTTDATAAVEDVLQLDNSSIEAGTLMNSLDNESTPLDKETVCEPAQTNTAHQYVCAKCTSGFSELTLLYEHYEMHLKKPEFQCQVCGKSFDLKFTLNRHLKKHKNAPF